jgi:hypothetical protein
MNIVTASSRKKSALGAAALVSGLTVVSVLLAPLQGCSSSSGGGSSQDGGATVSCSSDVGNSSGNPVTITTGQTSTGMICYQGVSNWFAIDVPSGSTLLDVAAAYPAASMTQVDLDIKVYFHTSSTTLTLVQELVASSVSGDAGGTGTGAIKTTVLVATPGQYYIQASDAHNQNFDQNNAYSLTVGYASDPDTHEPNDTTAMAKPADGKPGWLAYQGDLDVFSTSVASANDLLTLGIVNPASAPAPVSYLVTDSSGKTTIAQGNAPASAKTFSTVLPVTAAGTYYVTLSYPAGTVPSRAASDGYTLTFGSTSNPDTVNNHTVATAVCPGGGGSGPCSMAYTGSPVTLPPQMSFLAVPGQNDYYRVDVTSGAALVLQMDLTSSSSTVQYALDLLTPDPNSSCQTDSDCNALNQPCMKDKDCELSHSCLPAGQSQFCPTSGVACQLCEGAGLCIPNGSGGGVCAAAQFLSAFSPGQKPSGAANVSTAQPLFSNATSYYVRVHDATNSNYDDKNPYTLTLKLVPEPDPYDQSTTAAQRNNFYDPYPTAMTDRSPDKMRAVPLTLAQAQAGVTGFISYQTDEDWFALPDVCDPDAGAMNCGIDFQWVQPVSDVKVAIFVLSADTLLPEESFAYSGSVPPASPVTGNLDNSSCSTCSFGTVGKSAYVQITDLHEKAWDYSSGGKYSFKVTSVTPGCPAVCNGAGNGSMCISECAAKNTCCPMLQ